jgi:hypothetical protein
MALNIDYYGKQTGVTIPLRIAEATEYFANRLHETAWTAASDADKEKSLIAARGIIDGLSFKGEKATVYTLLQANSSATAAERQVAEAAQALEFPRGTDTVVPEAIRIAEYEIAYALLDGKDPELELENLSINAMSYGAVRTTYERTQLPIEHIINLCPSSTAWRLLRPFLRDSDALKLSRLS